MLVDYLNDKSGEEDVQAWEPGAASSPTPAAQLHLDSSSLSKRTSARMRSTSGPPQCWFRGCDISITRTGGCLAKARCALCTLTREAKQVQGLSMARQLMGGQAPAGMLSSSGHFWPSCRLCSDARLMHSCGVLLEGRLCALS